MASRASISAVVVLLLSLVAVFLLVSNNGVSTGVYLPDMPTHTPAPTAGPSPTPLPDPAAENWQESAPGQLSYLPRPESGALVLYNVMTLEEFAGSVGVDLPAEDAPLPALNVLEGMRASFEEEIVGLGLDAGPGAIDGPATELVSGVPVSRLRIQLDAQESATGSPFPGLDLVIGLIDRPGDEVQVVQYRMQQAPDPAIYQDFRAWLEANAVELSGAEATVTPDDDAAADETSDAGDEPSAEPTEEAAAPNAEETTDDDTTADATTTGGPWTELTPGVLMYGADPTIIAQIAYRSMPVDEFTEGSGFEAPAGDSKTPAIDVLEQLRATLTEQLSAQGITLPEDAFTGPEAVEIAGKPGARLRLLAPATTLENGQPFPGIDMAIILVELPEDQVAAIQYTYQGAPEASVYAEFEAWLAENAERATEPVVVEATPAGEAPVQDAPADATATPEAEDE